MTCKGILKIILIIFNTVIFFAGVASLVIGILVENSRMFVLGVLENINDLPPELGHLANAGYLLITVGAILTFIGFLGCCGACCENKCMLMLFFIILLVIFVAEVVTAILILVYEPTVEKLLDKIREKAAQSIKLGYGQNNIITSAWNETMSLLQCCGYNNYTDFTESPFVKQTSQYPSSCCATGSGQCDLGTAKSAHVDGCFDAVVRFVKKNSTLVGGVAVCVAAVEVIAMLMGLILAKK